MKQQTVFRVEHGTEINPASSHYCGPFQGSECTDGVEHYRTYYEEGGDPADHPIPCDDGITSFIGGYVFGAFSIRDLLEWFPCELGREAMEDAGFVIREYMAEVDDNKIGTYQIAFSPLYAECVREFNIFTLDTQYTSC